MSKHWDRVQWQDVSQEGEGPYESGLLKLNCDKALHHLKWRAIWDLSTPLRRQLIGIERSMKNLKPFRKKLKLRLIVISIMPEHSASVGSEFVDQISINSFENRLPSLGAMYGTH